MIEEEEVLGAMENTFFLSPRQQLIFKNLIYFEKQIFFDKICFFTENAVDKLHENIVSLLRVYVLRSVHVFLQNV